MQMQIAQHNRQVMQQLQQQRMLLGRAHPLRQINSGLTLHQASHMPLVNSPSSGNILHVNNNSLLFDFLSINYNFILATNSASEIRTRANCSSNVSITTATTTIGQ
jgi:hypothetical protein